MRKYGPRVLAYSHDGYGLGHLRRNLRIMSGLKKRRPDVDVALVTGAKGADAIVAGYGVRCFALPAVRKVANGHYLPEDGFEGADVIAVRKGLIEEAFQFHRPDLILVDRYPLGMKEELLPALTRLRREGSGAAVVLGLRDILDEPAPVREEWERAGHSDAIRRFYDSVLVYGDRALFDPITEYGIDDEIARLTRFTGYLTDDLVAVQVNEIRERLAGGGRRLALCTLGGGGDAFQIARSFVGAVTRLAPDGWGALLITGPYMAPDEVERLTDLTAATGIEIVDMVADLPSHLAAADAVVCMAGYNTVCEVLAMGAPAVVVPRVAPRREQLMRASIFASRGLVRAVDPEALSAEVLAAEIRAVGRHASQCLDGLEAIRHRGITESARYLDALLPVQVGSR